MARANFALGRIPALLAGSTWSRGPHTGGIRSCTLCDADGSCQPCCPSTRNVDDDWHLSWISIPERRALCTSDDWIAIHCCGRGRTDAGLRKRGGRMPVSVCSPAKPFPPRKYHSLKNL